MKLFLLAVIATIMLTASLVQADKEDYINFGALDDHCDYSSRVNPKKLSCSQACRQKGYSKGKCKGFGWKKCHCLVIKGQQPQPGRFVK